MKELIIIALVMFASVAWADDKKYTVAEIDEIRNALECRYIWGSACEVIGNIPYTSSPYSEKEMQETIDRQLRIFMLNGTTADEIYENDGCRVEIINGIRHRNTIKSQE